MVVPGGFEPPSQAPKAFRIDHYPTGLLLSILFTPKICYPMTYNMAYIWSFHDSMKLKTMNLGGLKPTSAWLDSGVLNHHRILHAY